MMRLMFDIFMSWFASYLHPTISSVHIRVANIELVPAACNEFLHALQEAEVIGRAAEGKTEEDVVVQR